MNFCYIAWYITICQLLQQQRLPKVHGQRRNPQQYPRHDCYDFSQPLVAKRRTTSSYDNALNRYRVRTSIPSRVIESKNNDIRQERYSIIPESSKVVIPASNVADERSSFNFPLASSSNRNIEQEGGIRDKVNFATSDFDAIDDTTMADESVIQLNYRNYKNRGKDNDQSNNSLQYPPLRTPIVYRYYPRKLRQQSRVISSASLPIILLGTNVDHWTSVAQQLSLRGFNVIAVGPKEEVLPSSTSSEPSDDGNEHYLEGPGLIAQLLDALRWKKVLLVGCDTEAPLAIQAALLLPPERIAGLLLCGNMIECEQTFLMYNKPSSRNPFELDRFLHERLACPFTIVWDGGTADKGMVPSNVITQATSSSGSTSMGGISHRSVIIGGGMAPHRRRPGIFAWIVTRFIEERIAPEITSEQSRSSSFTPSTSIRNTGRRFLYTKDTTKSSTYSLPLWLSSLPIWKYPSRLPVLWNVDDMFNEESMVVFGRIVATAIFYAISLKVLVYQYGCICNGIGLIASTPRNIVFMIRNRIRDVTSMLLFVARLPLLVLPFVKVRKTESCDIDQTKLENGWKNETLTNVSGDTKDEDIDPKSDGEIRPFFFLDHVVA